MNKYLQLIFVNKLKRKQLLILLLRVLYTKIITWFDHDETYKLGYDPKTNVTVSNKLHNLTKKRMLVHVENSSY